MHIYICLQALDLSYFKCVEIGDFDSERMFLQENFINKKTFVTSIPENRFKIMSIATM